MKINCSVTDGIFVMPKSVTKYLKTAKKAESKLIMYIFANINEPFDIEKAAAALSESTSVVNSALAFWRGTGIINESQEDDTTKVNAVTAEVSGQAQNQTFQNSDETSDLTHTPSYSVEDVSSALKNDTEFKALVDFAEHTVGELLNSSKTASLLYLYDCLGMQCDVIMGIIAHCAEIGKTSIKYIEKTAQGIHNDGVVTYRELESYYAAKKRASEYGAKVKKIIGAQDRALTAKEQKTVNTWANNYKTPFELVEYAYELTISSISKPSIAYMDKIISDWSAAGIKTKEDAQSLREKTSNQSAGSSDDFSDSFDNFSFEDIFERP